jgi:hypothetical protein
VNALDERLERVLADEPPPLPDAVEAVFRRAEQVRKRRIRRVLLTGLAAVLLVAALGYGLTNILLPGPDRGAAADPAGGAVLDPVPGVLAQIAGLTILPGRPSAGVGWRQYYALDDNGQTRGRIQIAAYTAPDGLCLPVLADANACALPEHAVGNVEYARYRWDADVNWQVNEVIARRLPGGRTIAVLATGERNTGDAEAGRPPLSGLQTAKAATDPRIIDAFGPAERCNDPAPADCPALRVKVPAAG